MLVAPRRATRVLIDRTLAQSVPRHICRPSVQTRTFLDTFLSSALGPCPLRKLSHTKTIPYSQSAIFKAVSDVSGYPAFLPFTISSHVTSRDAAGYPTQAKLKVGYDKFGVEESWDSHVHCDAEKGIVEARSSENASGGLFELLATRWQIGNSTQTRTHETEVRLDVEVRFQNSIYDQLFSQVEDKVAATMITAFENRVRTMEEDGKSPGGSQTAPS